MLVTGWEERQRVLWLRGVAGHNIRRASASTPPFSPAKWSPTA